MYLLKIFNAEYGDLEATIPAASFDDAVQAAIQALGTPNDAKVEASWADGTGSLTVSKEDVTLATIEYCEPAPVARDSEVLDACHDLRLGDSSKIESLFKAV
jgi:hypothetical protein